MHRMIRPFIGKKSKSQRLFTQFFLFYLKIPALSEYQISSKPNFSFNASHCIVTNKVFFLKGFYDFASLFSESFEFLPFSATQLQTPSEELLTHFLSNPDAFPPCRTKTLARVVRKADNAIHRINHYPMDSVVCFVNSYPALKRPGCGHYLWLGFHSEGYNMKPSHGSSAPYSHSRLTVSI